MRRVARQRQRKALTHFNIVSKHVLNEFITGGLGRAPASRTRSLGVRGPHLRAPQCISFNGQTLLFLDHGLEVAHDFSPDGTSLGWGLKALQDIPANTAITQYQVRFVEFAGES